ncbi:MAG: hypothetical protein QM673_17460 [Gordonia sp. (in: high G+C Gram-positive bacteria)]
MTRSAAEAPTKPFGTPAVSTPPAHDRTPLLPASQQPTSPLAASPQPPPRQPTTNRVFIPPHRRPARASRRTARRIDPAVLAAAAVMIALAVVTLVGLLTL